MHFTEDTFLQGPFLNYRTLHHVAMLTDMRDPESDEDFKHPTGVDF